MSGNVSGAYELKHRGKIHRVSSFNELKNWVGESRVTSEDSFRKAGSDKWISVMAEPEFALILNPDNQWVITMKSGVFKAFDFETIVKWAEDGRITEDAVIEGPRTPPGGVSATALPAIASNLKKQIQNKHIRPVLRIDGKKFPASDTETIRNWIKSSRVPVEAEISLEGKGWEPVSSCGLFDLEDWPLAAHGRVVEELLPEMPEPDEPVLKEEKRRPEVEEETPVTGQPFREILDVNEEDHDDEEAEEAPYIVISGDSEMAIESVAKIKSLLRKRMIFSYDEVRHPSISEERTSVGELLESMRLPGRNPMFWVFWGLAGTAVVAAALEYFKVLDFFTWLP
ncbi:MAG: hypothetical protein KAH54_07745 [Candidatus Sabulitectum sp.]|nr:hypothetical protein [Candidatus Sabulitectum sp.]